MFYEQELAHHDDGGGDELAQEMVHAAYRNEQIQESGTCRQGHQTGGIEREKALHGLVLHLEIVLSVQDETADDAAVIADDVGYDIIQSHMIQKGKHPEINARIQNTNQAIQDEVPILFKNMQNFLFYHTARGLLFLLRIEVQK